MADSPKIGTESHRHHTHTQTSMRSRYCKQTACQDQRATNAVSRASAAEYLLRYQQMVCCHLSPVTSHTRYLPIKYIFILTIKSHWQPALFNIYYILITLAEPTAASPRAGSLVMPLPKHHPWHPHFSAQGQPRPAAASSSQPLFAAAATLVSHLSSLRTTVLPGWKESNGTRKGGESGVKNTSQPTEQGNSTSKGKTCYR